MEECLPKRKIIRLQGYDYSTPGYYFITICSHNKQNIFCDITPHNCRGGCPQPPVIQLTAIGKIIEEHLLQINKVYPGVKLDIYVVMPNHVHFIIILEEPGGCGQPPLQRQNINIPKIINSFKTITSKRNNKKIWQRGYYEHIIRNEEELSEVREYIQNNPARWQEDKYFCS